MKQTVKKSTYVLCKNAESDPKLPLGMDWQIPMSVFGASQNEQDWHNSSRTNTDLGLHPLGGSTFSWFKTKNSYDYTVHWNLPG